MKQTRREFLRGAVGWSGLLLAGSLELWAARTPEPIRRAHRYLAAGQSADGAWRSSRYAAFREGDVLTPVVLWALQASEAFPGRVGVPPAGSGVSPNSIEQQRTIDHAIDAGSIPRDAEYRRDAHPARECVGRGLEWLRRLTDGCCRQESPWSALRYPLFTASYAAQVFARSGDRDRAAAWVKIIEQLRTSEALGWPLDDPLCGAWSDASTPPHYVVPVPDMLAPNISATALATGALPANAMSQATALPFIERCQNFAEGEPTKFDDGGFYFALDDPIRNKAGSAGRDGRGRERFHSYGSATCDGYLALRACGVPQGDPRVQAALEWLRRNSNGMTHGGEWPAGREEARASLAFYYSQALAAVMKDVRKPAGWVRRLRESISSELIARQSDDGSWQGFAPDSCEDEPLLSTAFALRTLALLA